MVTIMEMDSGKVVREPSLYDEQADEQVLGAHRFSRPEVALQLVPVAEAEYCAARTRRTPPVPLPEDLDAFLHAMARSPE